jgi:hypothetical protein
MHITLFSLKLGLHDLLDKRQADLAKSKAGKYFSPALQEQREAIDGLPPAVVGTAPLAEELLETDGRHDGYGATLWFATEATFRNPDSTADLLAAAHRVRDAFMPALGELKDKYALEAHRAQERKPSIKTLSIDLKMFPVAGSGTLLDVVQKFIDAGVSLDELLSQRGDAPKAARERAAMLRAEAIGVLGRFRSELVKEVDKNPSLPQDLDQRVFGYFDTLEAMEHKAKKKKDEPAPVVPPVVPAK